MKKILPILFIAVLPAIVFGQHLIPYLGKNNRYGFANENGQMVIEPMSNSCPNPLTPQRPYVTLEIDGKQLAVLKNGMVADATEYFPVQNASRYKDPKPDTLFQVLWGDTGGKLTLIDLDSRKVVNFLKPPKQKIPVWFSQQTGAINTYYNDAPLFYNGIMPVWKTSGSMNFVDIQLDEIFPRNFVAGALLNDQYFMLADSTSKYALGDKTGKIITPFIWSNLSPTLERGIFIVNKSRSDNGYNVGLLNGSGEIMLDTVHSYIHAVSTGKYLIVKKDGLYGICEYDGTWVLPLEYYYIEEIRNSGHLKVSRMRKSWDILDGELNSILENPVARISLPAGTGQIYAIVEMDEYNAYYDGKLRLIIRDSMKGDVSIISHEPLRIKRTNHLGTGVIDTFYNEIISHEYSSIYPSRKGDFFWVRKSKGRYGLKDVDGNTVVPEICEDTFEEATPDGQVFWCMDSSYFWTPYDSNGTVLGIDKKLHPRLNSNDFVGLSCKIKDSKDGRMYKATRTSDCIMVLADGTIRPLNDSLVLSSGSTLFNGYIPQIATRDGGFIIQWRGNPGRYYFNHRLQNLVKPGYEILELYSTEKEQLAYVENTGLLPVLRYKTVASGGTLEKKEEEPEAIMILAEDSHPNAKPQKKRFHDLIKGNEFRPHIFQTDVYKSFDAGGIINAKGEWVIPPKMGARFIPLSYYLAIEVPMNFEFKPNIYAEPLIIHKINQEDTSVIEVNRFGSLYFKSGDAIRISKTDSTGTFLLDAYINEKGEFLTDFDVVNGPPLLEDQNIITVLSGAENNEISQRIIGNTGKTIKELGKIICQNPYPVPKQEQGGAFFIVENKKYSLYENQEAEEAESKKGIMDSIGNLITRIKYKHIKILDPGRFFVAIDLKGRIKLYNWKGKAIYSFRGHRSTVDFLEYLKRISFATLPNGITLVYDHKAILVFSANNKLIRKIPYQYQNNVNAGNKFYVVVKGTEIGRQFFVNALSGREFKD